MEQQTNNSTKKIKYTPHGKKIQPEYTMGIEKGKKKLIKTGTTNIYEKIQQFKDECDIKNILNRIANGDYSMLRNGGQYGDFSNLPKSLNELQAFNKEAEMNFMKLPKEVRNEFDNDYGTFCYEIEKGTAKSKLNKYFKVEENKVEENKTTQLNQTQQTTQLNNGGETNE